MKFNLKDYLKKNPFLKDAKVLKNEEEEIHTKRLHVVITNDETGEIESDFVTNCMFLTGLNADDHSESYNLTFTAAPILDIAKVITTVDSNLRLLFENYPQLKATCEVYEMLQKLEESGEDE